MSERRPTVTTVAGDVPAEELGVVLPHEHLFNDLTGCVVDPSYPFSRPLAGADVTAGRQWALKQDPYCCADNVAPKDPGSVAGEVSAFLAAGGRTIVDATGSPAIGRDPQALRELSERTGAHVVMSTGSYLEKFEGERITARSVDQIAALMLEELREGVGSTDIRAGMIGEAGVSPEFTAGERASLRAAAMAQSASRGTALNIHLPGWQRRGHEVLDVVLEEMGAEPAKVSLAHSDPSGADVDYQRSLLDRGVWLEFDMIGLEVTFPGEGVSPSLDATADAVAGLVERGYGPQILLSHDLFLKQMWSTLGGNGFLLVPTVFLEKLVERGVDRAQARSLITDNPQRYLGSAVPA